MLESLAETILISKLAKRNAHVWPMDYGATSSMTPSANVNEKKEESAKERDRKCEERIGNGKKGG